MKPTEWSKPRNQSGLPAKNMYMYKMMKTKRTEYDTTKLQMRVFPKRQQCHACCTHKTWGLCWIARRHVWMYVYDISGIGIEQHLFNHGKNSGIIAPRCIVRAVAPPGIIAPKCIIASRVTAECTEWNIHYTNDSIPIIKHTSIPAYQQTRK